jgi:hypothetical protein
MPKEKCVVCGAETTYEFETHIDFRTGYIEGVGQHCVKCFNKGSKREMITIPKSFINDFSNDMELGREVRGFYYKNHDD